MQEQADRRHRIISTIMLVGAAVLIGIILWIDIATGLWQEFVILSGLAAGLVTFLLTVIVLNRFIARDAARRWAPVNRLAITEFLYSVADEERSEFAHGIVVPRALPDTFPEPVSPDNPGAELADALRQLREAVAKERSTLSDALSRWAEFLTTSGDNEVILRQLAEIAFQLDQVRDAALEYEESPTPSNRTGLTHEVTDCNTHFAALIAGLLEQVHEEDRLSGRASRRRTKMTETER